MKKAHKTSPVDLRSLKALLHEHGFSHTLRQPVQPRQALVATGVEALDLCLGGGLLRGAICEITGARSSGRTGLVLTTLARATRAGELVAYVDATDCFDQRSAAQAGVELERLLWIRCNPQRRPQQAQERQHTAVGEAWQAAHLVTTAGGFGVVAVDLGGLAERQLRAWQQRAWTRLKQMLEDSPTTVLVLASKQVAGSAADMVLQLHRERTQWQGLLDAIGLQVEVVKHRARRTAEQSVRRVP